MKISPQNILDIIGAQKKMPYKKLCEHFSYVHESTLVRQLQKLLQNGDIYKIKEGKITYYQLSDPLFIEHYFTKNFFERPKKTYNPEFLRDYIPNKTSFLGDRMQILETYLKSHDTLSTYDYQQNIRGLENLLIDLSFASSKLEGNTYSYLDTEVLIKYGETAEEKTQAETQMIINHKEAIQFILQHRQTMTYKTALFCELHTILGKNLLPKDRLGVIRNSSVAIGGSPYIPLEHSYQLREEFELFLDKLLQIHNPYEQSLFILVFLPYFQLFWDVNKRVSRIAANIPLIYNGLAPISLLQVRKRDYITAMLAVYELTNPNFLADIYVNNYIHNTERYHMS